MKILIPLPHTDFDPTEVGVPWKILTRAGHAITFATPDGKPAQADPIIVTGKGLGLLKKSLMADTNGVQAYIDLVKSKEFQNPIAYTAAKESEFGALILPGGHAKGMREYLESSSLQSLVGQFFASNKPVGAICHGTVLAARSKLPGTQNSVLHDRKTTALPRWMELMAWNLTRLWMRDYYRTYPITVQGEVLSVLKNPTQFVRGPWSFSRDSEKNLKAGWVLRDRNYLSARWPGDAHRFAIEFLELLK